MIEGMKAPLFIRPLTEDERNQVQAELRSSDAFVLRRCQILLASDRGERAPVIAQQLGCHKQTVLNVIHGFNAHGLAVLQEGSSRPHRLRTTFSEEGLERLQDLLHRSPRDTGCERGTWTLELVGPGQLRAGDHRHTGVRRKCAARPQTTQNQLEACQALDHQRAPRRCI